MKLLTLLISLAITTATYSKGLEISFEADDGVTVYGDVYKAADTPMSAPVILLFHQGASNSRAEYEPLVARLIEAGYHAVAIDQRRGGDHPDEIDAVLAFSAASGEPMHGCEPEPYSGQIALPVLALRPIREMEVPYVPGQMKLFQEHGHQTYVADPGVHGSSVFNESRVGSSTAATWTVVLDFLEANIPAGE